MGNLKAVFSIDKGLGVFILNSEIDKLKKGETLTCKVYDRISKKFDKNLILKSCDNEEVLTREFNPIKKYKINDAEFNIVLDLRIFCEKEFNKKIKVFEHFEESGIFSNDFKSYKSPIIYLESYSYFKLMYDHLPQ